MRKGMAWGLLALVVLMVGCGQKDQSADLCERTFVPYPDLISGRVIMKSHTTFLHAMEAYSKEDYAMAADSLSIYLRSRQANKAAHLYLANAYLALGKPFDAELQLDHLENSFLNDYRDQWEWYTVVCWACSGQLDRALSGARDLTKGRRHTYKAEAERLIADIERMAKP
jgi:hypothetical protein